MTPRIRIRTVAALLIACAALATAAALVGCSASRAPLATDASPATSTPAATASATASATAAGTPASGQPAAGGSATVAQPKVDAAGGAIGAPVTPSGKSNKPVVGIVGRPRDAAAQRAVVQVLSETEGAKVRSASVTGMTQDSKGNWWVLLNVDEISLGPSKAVIWYDGKKWNEAVFGVSIDQSDLPKDVNF
jgi:hypothetical protein